MNLKNLEYLTDYVSEAGFPKPVLLELKEKIKGAPSDFTIEHQPDFGSDAVTAILFFKNWKQTDLYYFSHYRLILTRENGKDCLQQIFYCGKKGPVIELQKGYNLLCGRPVYREKLLSHLQEEYNTWVQLNFQETDSMGNFRFQYFHDGYGYDLTKVIPNFPFLELDDPNTLNKLIIGLKQGNWEKVTLNLNGQIKTYYIEALPQFKSLRIYDNDRKQLSGKALMLEIALHQQGHNMPIPEPEKEKETTILEEAAGKKGKGRNKRLRA
jgi:hypothetical protein